MEWGDPRFHVTWQGSSVGQVCVFIGDVLLKSFLCFWLHPRRVALGDARMPCIALTFCVFFYRDQHNTQRSAGRRPDALYRRCVLYVRLRQPPGITLSGVGRTLAVADVLC